MILIIGGADQGKRALAMEKFDLKEDAVFTCTGPEVDFSARCIDDIEEFTYACSQGDLDPTAFFAEHKALWQDSILICQDIFSGVVPMEARNRYWRQITGRLCQYLSREADQVIRVFCGLEQKLK